MRQTVVGVFDRYAQAQHAAQQLRDSGFAESVFVTEELGSRDRSEPGATASPSGRDDGIVAHIRQFFSGLFGDDDNDVHAYADTIQRGGAVVRVEVDADADASSARQLLESAGAVDVDSESDDSDATPSGGVRVYPRVSETPAPESIELRGERTDDDLGPLRGERPAAGLGERGGALGSDDAAEFRRHFDAHFVGENYADFEPAYQYGRRMREDSRYTAGDWEASEPELRRDWEQRNPGGAWERFKAAVRHGWDRLTD